MDKICIIDKRADEIIKIKLKNMGYTLIDSVKCEDLQEPVSYHPDMVICKIGDRELIVAPNVYDYYRERLKPYGVSVIRGKARLKAEYPENIGYNVARMGKTIIHNFKYTDEIILDHIEKYSYRQVDVSQGYSKCSLGVISDRFGITSDKLIYERLKDEAKDILKIEPGHIELEGYNYGFIGGATGSDGEVFFLAGSLEFHPDGERIKNYFIKNDIEYIELSEGEIMDIGTMIFI